MKPLAKSHTSVRKPPRLLQKDSSGMKPASRLQWKDVLHKILDILPTYSGKFCPFCKVHRQLPLNMHAEDCAWRQGWELIDSDDK